MTNKEYENRNQDYGSYHNKDYYSSKNNESKSHIPSSIIFFIIVSILAGVIALDKLEIEKSANLDSTHTKLEVKHQQSPKEKNDIKQEPQTLNPIDKKRILDYIDKPKAVLPYNNRKEFEKALETADYESINITESYIRKKQYETRRLLEEIRLSFKDNKTKNIADKIREFKELKKDYYKFEKSTKDIIRLLEQKRSELDKNSNKRNIQNYYTLTEQQLSKELNDYISGKYTYRRNEKSCKPEDIQKEFISIFVRKNYPLLLNQLITKCSEKNQLYIDDEYYYSAYESFNFYNSLDCFEVFLNHKIDLKKVNERNNKDYGIIHSAASKGNINIIQQALNSNIPIDQRTNSNLTPLYLAIKNDKYEAVEYIINNGALTNERLEEYNNYGNILYYPVKNNNLRMLDLLVKNGIQLNDDLKLYTNNRSILRFIISKGKINNESEPDSQDKEWDKAYNYIKEGNLEELIKLENEGKDLSKMYYDGVPTICIAVENDKHQIVEYLAKKYDCKKLTDSINGRNALHYAVMGQSIKILDILLENGFNPNEPDNDKNTPLNFAACCNYNNPNFITKLLGKGANPNQLNNNNQNSLFFLTDIAYHPLFKSLLENGADINLQDFEGNTPLHHFLLKSPERKKYIASFLDKKANINLINNKKQTPLHLAILSNDSNAVWQLLNKGSDINQPDIDGNTGLHYAARYAPYDNMLRQIRNSSRNYPNYTIKNNDGKTPGDINPKCFKR